MFLFIGTYTKKEGHVNGKGAGLYVYDLDDQSGEISQRSVFTDLINPSFLCLHPTLPVVYAVQELTGDTGDAFGKVSALQFDAETGTLTKLNEQSTHGLAPCFVSVDPDGKRVMVANYMNGTIAVFPALPNGQLETAAQVFMGEGNGPHPDQDGPHAHSVLDVPGDNIVLAPDKGADKIMIYKVQADGITLRTATPRFQATPAGAGPRHLAFHPNGRIVYVINELDATVIVYQYEPGGTLTSIQQISTLPKGFEGLKACADIHLHPNGKFLYGSNRGHDSIVMYKIQEDGTLKLIGHEWTRGQFPRNFMVHPNGHYLYAANQNSDSVICFTIKRNGKLHFEGQSWDVPTPVCLIGK